MLIRSVPPELRFLDLLVSFFVNLVLLKKLYTFQLNTLDVLSSFQGTLFERLILSKLNKTFKRHFMET